MNSLMTGQMGVCGRDWTSALCVCVCDVHARVQAHFSGYVLQTWNPGLLEYQESRAAQGSRKMT